MKTAYVMSGSGTRLGYFAGAAKTLKDKGVEPDAYFGVSGGGHIAEGLARREPEDIIALVETIGSFYDLWNWSLPETNGLLNQKPLMRLLEKMRYQSPFERYCEVGLYRYGSSAPRYLSSDNRLITMPWGSTDRPQEAKIFESLAHATSAIPGLIQPAEDPFDSTAFYGDGGTVCNVPLLRAIELGYDTIYVMLVEPYPDQAAPVVPEWPQTVSCAMAALDSALSASGYKDMLSAVKNNFREGYKKLNLYLIAPSKPLTAGYFDAKNSDIRQTITQGAQDAKTPIALTTPGEFFKCLGLAGPQSST